MTVEAMKTDITTDFTTIAVEVRGDRERCALKLTTTARGEGVKFG